MLSVVLAHGLLKRLQTYPGFFKLWCSAQAQPYILLPLSQTHFHSPQLPEVTPRVQTLFPFCQHSDLSLPQAKGTLTLLLSSPLSSFKRGCCAAPNIFRIQQPAAQQHQSPEYSALSSHRGLRDNLSLGSWLWPLLWLLRVGRHSPQLPPL